MAETGFRKIEDVTGKTNTKASLLKLIDRIPGDIGWYSHSNKEAFYDIALKLTVDYNIPQEVVVAILTESYIAVSDEFGS